ncbi:hypothetical protein [Aestuariivirga sp.]|uniref:hypothetical protein n=1 Tax=Aestuariivirga sp. TaxID=2650926 RepID=UPI0039E719D4
MNKLIISLAALGALSTVALAEPDRSFDSPPPAWQLNTQHNTSTEPLSVVKETAANDGGYVSNYQRVLENSENGGGNAHK